MTEAVDPVLKNMWADLKWLIQDGVDFRELGNMGIISAW